MKVRKLLSRTRHAILLTFALSAGLLQLQADPPPSPPSATAITEVFGDGLRLTAVAIDFGTTIRSSTLRREDFTVPGRTITNVRTSQTQDAYETTPEGSFVIIDLDPEDADAPLYVAKGRSAVRKEAVTTITYTGNSLTTTSGADPIKPTTLTTQAVRNRVVDDFVALTFNDPTAGLSLAYNLYVPRNYDPMQRYPLVLFMHDAGATSDIVSTTLVQGLGAVVWAKPEEQSSRPCFVLAPQYASQTVNDRSEASPLLDVTVRLVEKIATDYSIDRNRLYATGQSGGGMMSIAMNVKYPDLFAASLLVACQWDASVVAPLARDRLWIVVSEGDLRAYPGQNAITARLEQEGATVNRAVWNGRWSAAEFARAYANLRDEGSAINYVALKKGTVVPASQEDNGATNHINTWRIAYDIEGLRAWLFAQHK